MLSVLHWSHCLHGASLNDGRIQQAVAALLYWWTRLFTDYLSINQSVIYLCQAKARKTDRIVRRE